MQPPPLTRADSVEGKVLYGLLLALLAGVVLLMLPMWPWAVLALWTADLTRKLSSRLTKITRGRNAAAALITVSLLIALLVPIGIGLAVLLPDVIELVRRATSSGSGRGALVELVSGNGAGNADSGEQAKQVFDAVQAHGKQALTAVALVASSLGSLGLGVLVYFVGTFAALVHGAAAYDWMRSRIPLPASVVDRLRDTFHETGRGLLYSVGLTAAAQAALATVAYVSLGVPRAFVLGLATLFTSAIPAVGPFLVWGPIALGLLLAGKSVKAAILVAVCTLIVAPADNVLRPLFARRGRLQLHPFLVFFSMLGGVVTAGGWGLMLGPLVFRMALELIAIARERAGLVEVAPQSDL